MMKMPSISHIHENGEVYWGIMKNEKDWVVFPFRAGDMVCRWGPIGSEEINKKGAKSENAGRRAGLSRSSVCPTGLSGPENNLAMAILNACLKFAGRLQPAIPSNNTSKMTADRQEQPATRSQGSHGD
jgi:hypothetical protein